MEIFLVSELLDAASPESITEPYDISMKTENQWYWRIIEAAIYKSC